MFKNVFLFLGDLLPLSLFALVDPGGVGILGSGSRVHHRWSTSHLTTFGTVVALYPLLMLSSYTGGQTMYSHSPCWGWLRWVVRDPEISLWLWAQVAERSSLSVSLTQHRGKTSQLWKTFCCPNSCTPASPVSHTHKHTHYTYTHFPPLLV